MHSNAFWTFNLLEGQNYEFLKVFQWHFLTKIDTFIKSLLPLPKSNVRIRVCSSGMETQKAVAGGFASDDTKMNPTFWPGDDGLSICTELAPSLFSDQWEMIHAVIVDVIHWSWGIGLLGASREPSSLYFSTRGHVQLQFWILKAFCASAHQGFWWPCDTTTILCWWLRQPFAGWYPDWGGLWTSSSSEWVIGRSDGQLKPHEAMRFLIQLVKKSHFLRLHVHTNSPFFHFIKKQYFPHCSWTCKFCWDLVL